MFTYVWLSSLIEMKQSYQYFVYVEESVFKLGCYSFLISCWCKYCVFLNYLKVNRIENRFHYRTQKRTQVLNIFNNEGANRLSNIQNRDLKY